MRRKTHRTPCIVEGVSNNEDIFIVIMKNCITLALSIPLNGQIHRYKTLNNKICNECINHIVNVNHVENSIKKLKPGKSYGFHGLTSDSH